MDILRFKEGFKDWKTSYDVEFEFGYDSDLRKKISFIVFYLPKAGKKLAVPWKIFRDYIHNVSELSYADSTGLCMKRAVNGLYISDSKFFSLVVQKDQLKAIGIAARRTLENVSVSVENILKEFTSNKSVHDGRIRT